MRQIDTLMQPYADPSGPGASVLLQKDGQVLFCSGYGLAHLEQQSRASRDTNYRLASCTKQFTAAAILLLTERGGLSLDSSIKGPLPELPDWADQITVRQLLTHTSGLVDYEDVIPPAQATQLHDSDVLSLLAAQPQTLFSPGSKYQYSNSGYALLAMVVERVSGCRFATFLRDRIFAPLHMHTTVAFEDGHSAVVNRAYGYSPRNGSPAQPGEGPSPIRHAAIPQTAADRPWVLTDQSLTSAVLGDGGVYSNVEDLARWLTALDASALWSPGSLALAFSPWVKTDTPGVDYGFGWRIGWQSGQRAIWHSGESIGFRSAIVRIPDERLAVCVLTNRSDRQPERLAFAISAACLGIDEAEAPRSDQRHDRGADGPGRLPAEG